VSFMTYQQFTEAQCNSDEDPVKPWDPEIHGPLNQSYFPIGRGDKWEMRTENNVPVYVPDDHEATFNWKAFSAAKRQAESEGLRRAQAMVGEVLPS